MDDLVDYGLVDRSARKMSPVHSIRPTMSDEPSRLQVTPLGKTPALHVEQLGEMFRNRAGERAEVTFVGQDDRGEVRWRNCAASYQRNHDSPISSPASSPEQHATAAKSKFRL